jgi:predicted Ser/Thr protein kinase/DNA-binding beta-propeller fold protein YncE
MAPLAAGTEVGGCLIEELVGRGGMGVVYRARQLELNRAVAIKLIAPERTGDAEARERFLREARAAAAVEHPNVLPVYGAGITDDQAFLVMRYVQGEDLRTLMRGAGSLPLDRVLEIVGDLGEALDAIHRAGLVHRDVKPANVLIDQGGNVYLSDFGLAKHVLTTDGLTASDRWVGTLDFAAPEQIRGGRVDARADVYALGCVLHLMLAGTVPFERDSDEAKLWAHLSAKPPLVSEVRPGLPAELDHVVQRALAKEPDDRFPSAGDLARAARAAAEGVAPAPERTVARGAAAPGGAASDPGLLDGSATAVAVQAGGGHRRRRALVLGAAAAAAVAAAAVILFTGDDAGAPSKPALAAAAAQPPRVGATLEHVGFRPRGVAIANGDLWVISSTRDRLTRIAAATMRRHGLQTRIGQGARSVAAHGNTVWVAIGRRSEVLKLDASTGRITGRIATPTKPWVVAADASGLWVAGRVNDASDLLLHYDDGGALVGQQALPDDITALTVGRGRVWAGISGSRVISFDTQLRHRSRFWLDDVPAHLAYGAGYVWASLRGDNAVSRWDPRTHRTNTTVAGHRPTELAVARGSVYVASYTDHRLVRLAAKTGEPVGAPIQMPDNPWAVTAGEGHVWVTGMGGNTLSRIDY